jgi:catechol-2,3-dioxygenase
MLFVSKVILSNLPISTTKRAGLYHFAILLPERRYMADMLQNLYDRHDQVHFDGLADHLVSESIYIRDPDFIGIEIYSDRPASEWKWDGDRMEMATLPLDTNNLLRESTDKGWKEMPPKTTIGHVHLHVRDLSKAIEFYHQILGLNLTVTLPSAAFFAAGQYHHHIPANWTFLPSSGSRMSLQKANRAYIPEKNKTGGIIGDPIIPSPSPPPSPSAPEEEEEITIPEDLKLPRIYGNERETSA